MTPILATLRFPGLPVVRDLASPEECAARQARIKAANDKHRARIAALKGAREAVATHGVRGPWELKTALESIQHHYIGDSIGREYVEKLGKLICELEDELLGVGCAT